MISFRVATGTANFQRFDVRLDAGRLRIELQGGGFTTASALNDDKWHHVAVVVPLAVATLGDVKFYIDGAFIGNMTGTQAINTATSPLRMGDSLHDSSRDFTGALDDVRLYNEALDDAAITALYTNGVANLPGILCLTASASAIIAGESTALTWEIDPAATSATIDKGVGEVLSVTTDGKGTISVSPAVTTTYTLTMQRGAESVQQQFTVIVTPAEPLVLVADGFIAEGVFQLSAENLVVGANYRLDFGADLATLVASPREVTSFTAAASVRLMLDEAAPAGQGFYRLLTNP